MFKRGDVVEAWGLVGIVQNRIGDYGLRITIDPVDPTRLYATPGPRWWINVPVTSATKLN